MSEGDRAPASAAGIGVGVGEGEGEPPQAPGAVEFVKRSRQGHQRHVSIDLLAFPDDDIPRELVTSEAGSNARIETASMLSLLPAKAGASDAAEDAERRRSAMATVVAGAVSVASPEQVGRPDVIRSPCVLLENQTRWLGVIAITEVMLYFAADLPPSSDDSHSGFYGTIEIDLGRVSAVDVRVHDDVPMYVRARALVLASVAHAAEHRESESEDGVMTTLRSMHAVHVYYADPRGSGTASMQLEFVAASEAQRIQEIIRRRSEDRRFARKLATRSLASMLPTFVGRSAKNRVLHDETIARVRYACRVRTLVRRRVR